MHWPAPRSSRGSSPLARGLHPLRVPDQTPRRIIPARAGFTVFSRLPACAPMGSSPLARGLLPLARIWVLGRGIIPARAGFTPPDSKRFRPGPDHPRSRGVYQMGETEAAYASGSSPLARGLLEPPRAARINHRIIPARAGFTWAGTWGTRSSGDHPRSRGVYRSGEVVGIQIVGSSPLARGLRNEEACELGKDGIIPARAGFTRKIRDCPNGNKDHPRSRGVYGVYETLLTFAAGSSPLARGLQVLLCLGVNDVGIIPARAGFTLAEAEKAAAQHGSSPLARGLHLRIPGIPTMSHATRPRLPSVST